MEEEKEKLLKPDSANKQSNQTRGKCNEASMQNNCLADSGKRGEAHRSPSCGMPMVEFFPTIGSNLHIGRLSRSLTTLFQISSHKLRNYTTLAGNGEGIAPQRKPSARK
ncbi:putative phospholipid-transporting ATPase IIB isoform X1 [Anopheles sinensis]|uniref:Putative phospholipid-transporting ATPase IIB isoform X1 n=1 Tax=Anopheles sinensis TaxID=74873 RepID=A0A084VEK1_ANOSI|nr:putative phospholipid-transporting ATPase IIB isoform X1 [Anopheles sinensis]